MRPTASRPIARAPTAMAPTAAAPSASAIMLVAGTAAGRRAIWRGIWRSPVGTGHRLGALQQCSCGLHWMHEPLVASPQPMGHDEIMTISQQQASGKEPYHARSVLAARASQLAAVSPHPERPAGA